MFDQGEFIFASAWPVWALTVSFAVVALVIAGLLIRQRNKLPWPRLLGIAVLQLTMLALVLVMIWQPALRTERLRAGDNVVAVSRDDNDEGFLLKDARPRCVHDPVEVIPVDLAPNDRFEVLYDLFDASFHRGRISGRGGRREQKRLLLK
ncbi:MAG: hypothetical protein IH788_05655 [Nitrospinae bacterium]|nr:hypothetical protein [Nitrospinota bacterium]